MNVQRPSHEQIAARAHQIFRERGGTHGHDRDDWLQAEYELMQLPVRKLAELPAPKSTRNKVKKPSLIHVVRHAVLANAA